MAVQRGKCSGGVNNTVTSPGNYRESFSSEVVHNEVIVKFIGFYTSEARRGYIAAALSSLPVSYQVLERDNLMSETLMLFMCLVAPLWPRLFRH